MSNIIAPKLRNLFFNTPQNSGQAIETEPKQPTDAEIIAVLKEIGIINRTGTADPSAAETEVTPLYAGEMFIDTENGIAYFATGTTASDWVALGNAT